MNLSNFAADAGRARMVLALAGASIIAVLAFAGLSGATLDPSRAHDHTMHMESAAGPAARPATVTRPIACEKLPNVPGKSITTVIVEFPPRAYTPAHRHPGSVTAFVIRGTVRSQLAGEEPRTFGPLGTWFEPPGTLHLFAENPSATERAELLAIFIADNDCGPLVVFER